MQTHLKGNFTLYQLVTSQFLITEVVLFKSDRMLHFLLSYIQIYYVICRWAEAITLIFTTSGSIHVKELIFKTENRPLKKLMKKVFFSLNGCNEKLWNGRSCILYLRMIQISYTFFLTLKIFSNAKIFILLFRFEKFSQAHAHTPP